MLEKFLRQVVKDPPVFEVDLLDAGEADLEAVSEATGIGLSLDEMKRVQAHFRELGRNPRDVELEALGQAWSEHCCYKSSKPLLKKHVYGIAEEKLVAREDAGVAPFDGDWDYVVKIESHNHPSAIEPYGGSATGIGGVLRDVACMGAQPVALVDPLFFGPLDLPWSKLPAGTKHPKYLLGGVVAGIRDYGNRVGIPTVAGQVSFHPKYVTNCLVNVGCVGIMKRESLIHSRVGNVGDKYILMGGRTGRDGIHGVTFASKDLSADAEEESRGAVQLGDPITKEPLLHAALETNDKKLLTGMKDLGGGGLSCVCGEMALDAGLGANIHLDRAPLKEPGMKPWEIWVSESQERMMVSVRPENVDKVLAICRKWDVEATVLGEVTAEKAVRVFWGGEIICEMDSEFLYGGPEYERPAEIEVVVERHVPPKPRKNHTKTVLQLLSSQNVCSREQIIRQYDHEVRANTVIKPLHGRMGTWTHGDAAVLRPVAESWKGLALTSDVNPNLTDLDAYWGTASAVEETLRNLAAVGARLDSIADNLNLPNPQKPRQMGKIHECARALGDAARALHVPFVSGNVSMYNESAVTPIPVTPTLLGVGIVQDVRKCVTADLKRDGARLYLAGAPTTDEMGGSEYYRLSKGESNRVPRVDWDFSKKAAEAVVTAIEKGLAWSCHDVGMGGLAVAVAEMGIGGDLGASVHLDGMGDAPADVKLFSESNSRWVIEARDARELEAHFAAAGVPLVPLGVVAGEPGTKEFRFIENGKNVARLSVTEARKAFTEALPALIGGSPESPPEAPAPKRAARRKPAKAAKKKTPARGKASKRTPKTAKKTVKKATKKKSPANKGKTPGKKRRRQP